MVHSFGLLIRKNLIVEKRCVVRTLCEITIIIGIFLITVAIRPESHPDSFYVHNILRDLTQFKELMDISEDVIPYKLYFTPNDATTQNIIKSTVTTFKISGSRGFDTEAEMISHFNAEEVFAGVVLNDFNMTLLFPNYFRTQYKKKALRMIDFWLTRCSGYKERNKLEDLKHVDFYVREGFLHLYDHLLKAKYNTGVTMEKTLRILDNFNIMSMSSIYHDANPEVGCVNDIDRRGLTAEGFLNSALYSFLYFVPFLHLVWKYAGEHEENIFAHNWLYGYSYEAQRYAHYAISFLHFLLLDIIVLLCILVTWHSLMPLQQILLIFVYIVMYSVLLIIYAMTLSTLLANARAAIWCGACLWIATYAVFAEVLTLITLDVTKWKIIIIFTIFFNNMLASGVFYLKEYKNITASTAIALLVMQLFVLVIYICVLKIIDFVKPGRYIKNIWLTNKCRKQIKKDVPDFKTHTFEDNIEYGHLSGQILKLKDVSGVCAFTLKLDSDLKNISMKFFKNEISVLVAPNGSGKSTLIATLAGWQDHQGQIRFYRNDEIIDNWLDYRQYVDVAMPNNALYDELTVKETLRHFIATKQLEENRHEMENEIEKWLKILRVNIEDCDKIRVKNLSFGEKRLLVLCCILSCNTPVILLDEPTMHMKADHQYAFWEILNSEKSERAIIITTSSIDEANEIGDRIGILYKGHLMAYGSSFYLRTRFGKGFYLICLIQPMKPVYPITQLIKKFIPNVQLHQQFNDRVIYLLPADKKAFYQRVLIELEKEYTTLGISNVYVTGSHLNDIYMAMTREPDMNNYNNLPDLKNTLKFLQDKKPDLKKCPETVIFHKKLYCQAKNSLPLWAIFISWFLIHALSQISLDYLNDTVIVFASGIGEIPSAQPHIEIREVRDLKHGVFIYDNIQSDNSSLHKKMVALRPAEPIIHFHMNEKVFHTAMLSFHAAYNFKGYEMTVINKPVKLISNRGLHLTLGIIMPLTMCMVFVALTEERFNFMMALQRIAGLKDRQFWIMSFIWDYTIYLLISLVYLVIIISDAFRWQKLVAAYVLFMCGMLSLTFIYLMTLFFDETHCIKAYFKILCIHLVIGILPYVLYINAVQYYLYFEYVFYILMLSPGFAILHGTSKIFNNNEPISLDKYFQWDYPGFLDSIFFLTLTAFILAMKFLVVFILRKRHMQSTPKKVKSYASVCYPYDDERVVKEKVRISNMNVRSCRAHSILVDQLESELPKTGNRVKAISFSLNYYSCLGIYGSRHAGKSHLLKQLVMESGFWFGEVYIAGFNCKHQMSKAIRHVGFCPQDKGFNPLLTPREIFQHFLLITGVKKSNRLKIMLELSISLKLRRYMNTRIEHLPENIKRRVNVAIALIANNHVLIFDEPCRGLSSFDRQLIWSILKYSRSLGNTIIFTSYDTVDLKELADEIIIVNDGEMLAYDNPHTIEYQYNIGFCLEIKLYTDGVTLEEVEENLKTDIENLHRFMAVFHGESEMLHRSGSVVKYYIPAEEVIYSYIFGAIEKSRNRLNISDYTLTPLSLPNALKLLQKSRKEKTIKKRAGRAKTLKDPKVLPRRD